MAFLLNLVGLGGRAENTTANRVEQVFEYVAEQTLSAMSKTDTVVNISQATIIDAKGSVEISDVTMDATVSIKSNAKQTVASAQDVADTTQSNLEQKARQDTDSTADLLTSLIPWGKSNTTVLQNSFSKTNMRRLLSQETLNSIITNVQINQDIVVRAQEGGVVIKGIKKHVAVNIISDTLMNSTVGQQIKADLSQTIKQQNDLKAEGLSSALKWIAIAGGVVGAGYLVYTYGPSLNSSGGRSSNNYYYDNNNNNRGSRERYDDIDTDERYRDRSSRSRPIERSQRPERSAERTQTTTTSIVNPTTSIVNPTTSTSSTS
jgi:hypothetical protein